MVEMKILVTGGTGLAGRAIQEVVNEGKVEGEWIFVNSKDANLLVMEEVDALFQKIQPTHVVHLAAKVGGLFANMRGKVDFFRDNMALNGNVMECCRIYKVQKLITCLSTCIFPAEPPSYPIDETMLHLGEPHKSNYGYAFAKRMVDVQCSCYRDQYGCNFFTVTPANLYGPHDQFSIDDGHVIPGLIHKCYLAKKNGTDFTMWGTGKPLRQFLYSKDFARLTIWALFNYTDVETLLLSPPDETAISDIAQTIKTSMGFEGNLVCDTTKSDGQYKRTMSIKKLQSLCPDFKFTPLEQGLAEASKWFCENYDIARK
eukprot:GEMP01042107.1.p1 GENE.GEMP01042107.1~~GEMP01042107.1.p1  ORF type:complete len:325 (+),score=54.39 GEMP01042107.1:31-975(+)